LRAINILLVEDNEGDILLTKDAFEESNMLTTITVIRDGAAAISFFESKQEMDTPPDLVLLDINLPKVSGYEVLTFIKSNKKHQHIPVIVLTTSAAEKDIEFCYQQYANCYITKPTEITEFIQTIIKIEDFWTNIVSIPSK